MAASRGPMTRPRAHIGRPFVFGVHRTVAISMSIRPWANAGITLAIGIHANDTVKHIEVTESESQPDTVTGFLNV